METPGHVDFSDEMTVALRLADGAVLVVDAVEGVMLNTERAIRHVIQQRISIVLVINKVDKLITELKLTPTETYFKLHHIVETVNDHIIAASSSAGNAQVVDPVLGNVCFASARDAWFFTLQSFAKMYVKLFLWGDYYFDSGTKTFSKEPYADGVQRSFVQCVLDFVYKTYRLVNGNKEINASFGAATAFMDMLANHIPSAKDAAIWKVDHIYTGPKDSAIYKAIRDSDSTGPLMVNVTKLYTHSGFLGRVYSGELMTGHTVRVLREEQEPPGNDEVMTVRQVTRLWVCQACCSIPISKAPPGSLVLIGGVDDAIEKTTTLCNLESNENIYIFRPLQFNTLPVVKIAFSLLNGWSLDDISEELKRIIRSYPLAILRVEELGICTIFGTGELYLKYIMEDVRRINLKVELEVADPVVSFRETVVGSSLVIAKTPNKRNKITLVAESLE
ncbi:hypothetical protein H5410_035241 [Solanum commersonii]|uniref:Tr-type G domain-containing protein n=1 Tax=Solanum commersonii TaxID=4109 RepID=A0A9J5Y0N7_SOLCO|nr:hypothetical protein H5410_035241 [Solanum commersonii]